MRSAFSLTAVLAAFAVQAEIRLVEPRDGDRLRGGATAIVEWTSDGPLDRGVEEWEAFLSFDGGRYYATRVTPHLDAELRRFAFEVPNVPSGDVRLLLRFGDEAREEEVELPARFSIEYAPAAIHAPRLLAAEEGEAAREGERGVAMWVEGDRDGSDLRIVVRSVPALDRARVVAAPDPDRQAVEETDDDSFPPGRAVSRGPRARTSPVPNLASDRAADLLLVTRRLNL